MANAIPPRPVVGQPNAHGGLNTQYDIRDWENLYGSGGTVDTAIKGGGGVTGVDKNIKDIYGESAGRVGQYTDQYMSGVLGNVGKNVANADYYNQQAGRERGIANTKAGLSNVDTSAADEQSRRNAIYGAAGVNEAAKREANQTLGKAAGNIASGINRIKQQDEANRLASMGTPVPEQQSGGVLSELFGWLL